MREDATRSCADCVDDDLGVCDTCWALAGQPVPELRLPRPEPRARPVCRMTRGTVGALRQMGGGQ